MKLKPIYIYLALIIVALVTIVIFSSKNDSSSLTGTKKHIHEELNSQPITPSSNNVTADYLDKMNEFKNKITVNPNDTLILNEYADFLAAGHKENEAIIYLNQILEIDNKRVDVLSKISIIYFNMGNFREAKEYLVKSLALDAGNIEAKYNLGVVEARIGDLEAAKKQWEDLVANHPNSKMSDMAKESLERLSSK